jgi:hypothetical protein
VKRNTIGAAVAGVVAAGALGLGGVTLANAAPGSTTPSAPSGGYGQGAPGRGTPGQDGARSGPGGGSQDTPVTGDEASKVTAAVKAKDSAVTVSAVRKDPDGSYDVLGTKAGSPVFFDVSKDLKTITGRTGGPGGGKGPGGPGGSQDAAVTGAEAAKVTAAVKAKDSAVTVSAVRKDPDGSYDVLGTKAGSPVFYEVSKDLATVTERAGGPGPGGKAPGGQGRGQTQTPNGTGSSSTTN